MARTPSDLEVFIASMGGERQLRVEENLGDGFVVLRVAEAERRQAKHDVRYVEDAVIEMLRNARDAGARHIYVAMAREGDFRTIVMIDDGCGIPPHMTDRIFDARVTSKLETMHTDRWGIHGRGMALYAVRENAVSAEVVATGPGLGSSIKVVFDTSKLPERADQSKWPAMGTDEDGNATISKGPHNVIRTCCEFALEDHDTCEVYVGSIAEIATTARKYARHRVQGSELLLMSDYEDVPLLQRLNLAIDARELSEVAEHLGLDMSTRTAHRVISGEIKPLRSVWSHLTSKESDRSPCEIDLARDRRGLKLSADDTVAFSRMMERDFAYLAERYYLQLASDPKVRYSNGKLTVTFEVESDD